MVDREGDRRSENRWPVDVLDGAELTAEMASLLADAGPDPDKIESGLSELEAPALDDIDVRAATLSESAPISPENADAVVDAGGEAVAVSVEAGEETANVLLDAGDEAVEVVVEDGGEVAAEAVVEVLAAALDGV